MCSTWSTLQSSPAAFPVFCAIFHRLTAGLTGNSKVTGKSTHFSISTLTMSATVRGPEIMSILLTGSATTGQRHGISTSGPCLPPMKTTVTGSDRVPGGRAGRLLSESGCRVQVKNSTFTTSERLRVQTTISTYSRFTLSTGKM